MSVAGGGVRGQIKGTPKTALRFSQTLVTALRVIGQTVLSPRAVAVLLLLPGALITLLAWCLSEGSAFQFIAPAMLVVYPLLTSTGSAAVLLLRERRSGTLQRLLTLPFSRFSLVLGYIAGYFVTCLMQATSTTIIVVSFTGLNLGHPLWVTIMVVTGAGVLGSVIGLLLGAVTRTELEAIQLTPAIIVPQFFLAGVIVPRNQLPELLDAVAEWLPLTHAVQAASAAASTSSEWHVRLELTTVAMFIIALGAAAGLLVTRRSN